jgi:RimJ/RimL family protein N-acetyltransferase
MAPGVRVVPRPDERGGRPGTVRRYPAHHPAFAAISLGDGAVVSVSPELLPAVEPLYLGATRDDVFDIHRLAPVSDLLRPHSLRPAGPYLRLSCGGDTLRHRSPPSGMEITVEQRPAATRLDALAPERWPNAVGSRPQPAERPSAAVALASRDGAVVGVATVTDEAKRLWQIGIDVAEHERGQGVGAALITAVAGHALNAGRIPWYGVAPSNLASVGAALAAGFRPAWVEVFTTTAG